MYNISMVATWFQYLHIIKVYINLIVFLKQKNQELIYGVLKTAKSS
jgi:hypothetical protein